MTYLDRGYNRGLLIIFLGASCIGFAPILSKLAIETDQGGMTPTVVAFWRLALAIPCYLIVLLCSPNKSSQPVRTKIWWLCLPGLVFAADLGLWHWSFEYTSLANATIEANLATVIVGLVGWLWFKEQLTWLYFLGAFIAVIGLGILVGFSFDQQGDAWIGDVLGIATAFCYAGYMLTLKILVDRFSVGQILFATSVIGSCALGSYCLLMGEPLWPARPVSWWPLLGLTLSSQLAGQTLIANGLKLLPASLSGGILLWQPVMAALLAWWIFGQTLSLGQLGAGLTVLVGIYLVKLGVRP